MDRFHKAAKEGLIEILKEATRRDCNGRDELGMTPTLYAALHGHLEALRLLCGKGGDPDKADFFGNTALHLSASQGHKAVVTFLVNFGANVYAMDIDGHTPQELAGINNREDILRFLDGVTAKLDLSDKRKSKTLKDKAKKDADKRIKEFNKRQAKADAQALKYQKRTFNQDPKPSVINTLKLRIKSGSMSNLSTLGSQPPRHTFSTIVNGGSLSGSKGVTGTVQRKILSKQKLVTTDEDFKVSEMQDGKRSLRSISGICRDSEVMYAETTFDNSRRSRLGNIFNESTYSKDDITSNQFQQKNMSNGTNLIRSLSQPDFIQELNNTEPIHHNHEVNMFARPGIGSLAFRKSITNTLQTFPVSEIADESSIGSAGSLAARQRQFVSQSFDEELSDPDSSDDEQIHSPLERFLTTWGLGEYIARFEEQKIDLDTLMILTESDLKTLNLPLGPYRKLVTAISERKNALEHPGVITDSQL